MNAIVENILMHYGVARRSGRYPWGSGENPYQHSGDFLSRVQELKNSGLSETDIAKSMGLTTTQLRTQMSLAKDERRSLQVATAKDLRAKGYSLNDIAKQMGFSNDSSVGNDDEMNDHGYKIRLIYGCLASPSAREHNSINENTEAMSMSWEFDTTPVKINIVVDGKAIKPMSSIEIDSTKVEASKLAKLEEILYGKDPTTTGGSDGVEARLPLPDEVYKILGAEG